MSDNIVMRFLNYTYNVNNYYNTQYIIEVFINILFQLKLLCNVLI